MSQHQVQQQPQPRRSTLIPIRVDVASDDKNVRIVDTLLLDPTCWPTPLYLPLQESVERNIRDLAYSVLSDAEVAGMGRTVRHFTGRVDVWSTELQTKLEDQLRPQIWSIVNGTATITTPTSQPPPPNGDKNLSHLIPIAIRLMIHGITIHEDFYWDPSVPVSPMELAQEMAKDFNLPEEAVVAIVISILEQLYGLPMDLSPDESLVPTTTTTTGTPTSSSSSERPTGAWLLDPKETVAMTNQIITQHRPA
jgi:hypothetical protein